MNILLHIHHTHTHAYLQTYTERSFREMPGPYVVCNSALGKCQTVFALFFLLSAFILAMNTSLKLSVSSFFRHLVVISLL